MPTEQAEVSRRQLLGYGSAAVTASAMPSAAHSSIRSMARLFSTEAGKGRNVMLLHGWTADAHDWSWQLPLLESRYRVVCVDLRGHGRSEIMASGNYDPARYVADVENLIVARFRGEKFILIGHSMGGQIAARLALKRPDLVDAVISVDGSLGFSAKLAPVFQKVANDLLAGDPRMVAPALFELFYDAATPAAFKRWHKRRVQGMPVHVVRESFGPLFLGTQQVGVGTQSELFCRQLRVPFYHMCRDAEQAGRMRPLFSTPRSKVELWKNAGHWIMQDRFTDVNAAMLAWIDALEPAYRARAASF